jgi:ZIP family zinc transporter
MEMFLELNIIVQVVIATVFTWGVTSLGASMVFLFKSLNAKALDLLLGFAAGVMLAASFWSLLNPAVELSEELGKLSWFAPCLGFFMGGIFVMIADLILEKITSSKPVYKDKKRSLLLVGAITLHNVPEGLAIGVAFASASLGIEGATTLSACLLALGIGLQNFPEGAGVSLPLRRDGYSKSKSFFYGQASGIVEPFAGLIGVLLASFIRSILPFLLSFAAGCMVLVVTRELVPEASKDNKNHSSIGFIFGFIIMMLLDVSLG